MTTPNAEYVPVARDDLRLVLDHILQWKPSSPDVMAGVYGAHNRPWKAAQIDLMTTEISRLHEALQMALDNGWHHFHCSQTRRIAATCTCGWERAQRHIEGVLQDTVADGD